MLNIQNIYDKIKILNGSWLKLIAVVTMVVDHISYLILPQFDFAKEPFAFMGKQFTIVAIGRLVGRLAFPIFAFLIVEGFKHTSNRKKYGINLLTFAVISEVPFDFFLKGKLFDMGSQNIFFTLFLGFLAMYCLENLKNDILEKAILVFCTVALAVLLDTDYGAKGVILIVLLYILKENLPLASVLSYGLLSGGIAAWCAFIPINMYNGKRGFIKGRGMKYFFYAFYPVHLLVLALIRKYLF